jgi:hypothetical protein
MTGSLKRKADGGISGHDVARVRRPVLVHVMKESGKSEIFKLACKKENIKYYCEHVKITLSPINMKMENKTYFTI